MVLHSGLNSSERTKLAKRFRNDPEPTKDYPFRIPVAIDTAKLRTHPQTSLNGKRKEHVLSFVRCVLCKIKNNKYHKTVRRTNSKYRASALASEVALRVEKNRKVGRDSEVLNAQTMMATLRALSNPLGSATRVWLATTQISEAKGVDRYEFRLICIG